jgi:hypothetical protein
MALKGGQMDYQDIKGILFLFTVAAIALVSICGLWMILNRLGRDQSTPILWGRVWLGASIAGLLVWPISAFIISRMTQLMQFEVTLDQAPIYFLVLSGIMSGILTLLLTGRRRLDHLVLMTIASAPIAFALLIVLVLVLHARS